MVKCQTWKLQPPVLVGFDLATRDFYSDSGSAKKGKQNPLQVFMSCLLWFSGR